MIGGDDDQDDDHEQQEDDDDDEQVGRFFKTQMSRLGKYNLSVMHIYLSIINLIQ